MMGCEGCSSAAQLIAHMCEVLGLEIGNRKKEDVVGLESLPCLCESPGSISGLRNKKKKVR